MSEEKVVKEVKFNSKSGQLMIKLEDTSKVLDEKTYEKEIISDELLKICSENEIDKLILDDEQPQLLTLSKISKEAKKWDDSQILKTLTDKQKKKVMITQTKIITVIDYEEVVKMYENKEIKEEDFLNMYKITESSYVQMKRVKR